jgi:hypothetical protein
MIPVSRDQLIKREVDDVLYSFLPPVGDVEMDVLNSQEDVIDVKPHYAKAESELEAEYKGKRKPKKDQWQKLIKDRIMTYIDESESKGNNLKKIDSLINITLMKWESEKHDLPEFKKGDCAGDMPSGLKIDLYNWYWDQFNLPGDELKN